LHDNILGLPARFNRCGDATLVLPSDHLGVVITRR
jgi:hypothetical protein